MKKAFIDQILLGLMVFTILILLGATISDDVEARNKYYKLKKLTENTAMAAGKYYSSVNDDTDEAEDIASAMLDHTNLGKEIKDSLVYTWDFDNEPNSLIVTLPSYTQDTFWYKFINLDSFTLKAESKVELGGDTDPRCICGETAGVGLVGRILCVVGTEGEEQVQIASDSSDWKVKSVFDNGSWEEEVWYGMNLVDEVYVIALSGDDQIQLNDISVPTLTDGGCGDDQIQGSTSNDTIYGNEGNDQIEGKEGDDIIYGGNGDDQLQGGNDVDTLYTDGNDSTVDAGGQGGDNVLNAIGYSDDCSGTVTFECGENSVVLVY